MQRLIALGIGMALASPTLSYAAVLYIDPPSGTYGPGDTFIASVRLNADECVNATQVEIAYPKETLRAVDFSRGSSILTLWVEEPSIDIEKGTVAFSGGIPGGYCGRIKGDPVVSNILGKIVFTVIDASAEEATVSIQPSSRVLRNDGAGTPASLTTENAFMTIVSESQTTGNPWLNAVGDDEIPPDAFAIEVQSTRGVFDGDYYIVFSTVDKQSGLDHYEIFERGVWKHVSSPYEIRDQALREPILVKAIDKAGNERLGEYVEGAVPPRESAPREYLIIAMIVMILVLAGGHRLYRRFSATVDVVPPTSPPQA